MKKIVLNAVIRPSDDAVTLDDLKKTLKHLGAVEFGICSEIEYAEVNAKTHTKVVWLYVPCDDAEPYYQVDLPGKITGKAVSNEEATHMQQEGICVEFRAQYPRADRYGAPAYATRDEIAAAVVADHGFRVANDDFEAYSEDRGDDGGEEVWFKIVLPEEQPTKKKRKHA